MLNCTPSNKKLKKKDCFNKADWTSLHEKVASMSNDYLQLNETSSRSVHENWNYFHKNLMQAVEAHIPSKYISNSKKLPWMTPELNRLIKKKQRLYNKAKNLKTAADWTAYKNIQHQVRQSIRIQHNKYLASIINSSSKLNGNKPLSTISSPTNKSMLELVHSKLLMELLLLH